MTKQVNLSIENWQPTGTNVPFPQYTVDVAISWVDQEGAHEHSGRYRFPNVLQNVPLRRLRRYMERIVVEELRYTLGLVPEDPE